MPSQTTPVPRSLSLWDTLGISASALCAIHCLALPFVVGFLPALATYLPGDEELHKVLAFVVAGFGALAFWTGYRRHRRMSVLMLMAAGLGVIFFTTFYGCELLPSCDWEPWCMVLGGMFMIAAHIANGTFCRTCAVCKDEKTCSIQASVEA